MVSLVRASGRLSSLPALGYIENYVDRLYQIDMTMRGPHYWQTDDRSLCDRARPKAVQGVGADAGGCWWMLGVSPPRNFKMLDAPMCILECKIDKSVRYNFQDKIKKLCIYKITLL